MANQGDEAPFETLVEEAAGTLDVTALPKVIGPGVELAGRFLVEGELGAGGMGRVFAAFDRTRGTRVAIKLLGKLTPHSIVQLKREFRAAAELVHPNLVRLHELFSDGPEWFFTMDVIEGSTLPKLLERPGESTHDALRRVFGELATALRALHQAGTLHGDLKPSNFLIAARDQRVVLLDFGLASPPGAVHEGDLAGTPGYMAPEQALGETLTEAADWYSFGVVLYEALTGTLPFRWPIAARLEGAPEDLARLCLQLLQLNPADRPRGDEVCQRLGLPDLESTSVVPPTARSGIVGRQAELTQLDAAFELTVAGQSAMAYVHGASGIGKTALVEKFLEGARRRGAVVLHGRCRERESMSYKAVDGLIDDIIGVVDGSTDEEARALLPKDIADLTILFPALRAAAAVARSPRRVSETQDLGVVRLHAIAAFAELLSRLARLGPLVVWIDDLQWSDAESALLLGPVLGGARRVPMLFVGSYRSDLGGRGATLDAMLGDRALKLPAPADIALGPLRTEDAERLARDILRSDGPGRDLARSIARDGGGHPLFIAELAHAASSTDISSGARVPSTLSELVTRRIASLPVDARSLLEVAAVAGVPRPRKLLCSAQGLDPAAGETGLDLLRASRLARSRGLREHDAVDIHHDRIREIVLQSMTDARRARCHLDLATVLEADPAGRPDAVAAHYEAGGDVLRAGRSWIAAADHACKALAFGHAATLYERGLSQAALEPEERHGIEVRRAEALAHAGKGPAAAGSYLAIAATCGPDDALELRRRAAEQLFLCGHVEQGLGVIAQVLDAIGMRQPRSGREAILSIALGRLRVRARGLGHVARSEGDMSREEIVRLDAAWTVACALAGVDLIRAADFQSMHLLLALRAGEPRRLLRALSLEAFYTATPGVGSERRTARLLAVADDLARSSDDYSAIGFLLLAHGTAAYLRGRLDSAITNYEEALNVFTDRCVGAVWEIATAHRFLVASFFFLGRLRRLSEFVPPLLAQAEGTGNLYATMPFRSQYGTASWLVLDDVAEARRQLDRAQEEGQSGGSQLSYWMLHWLLIGQSHLDLYTGDAGRSFSRLEEEWPRLEESQLFRVGVLRVQFWQLRAASAAAAAASADARGQAQRARELRDDARKSARRLRRDPMPRAAPLAGLVEAALDRSEGEIESSERRLKQCIRGFDDQGLRLFSAAARVRLGELARGNRGELLAQGGYAEFEREGVVSPGRWVGLLAPGFGPGVIG